MRRDLGRQLCNVMICLVIYGHATRNVLRKQQSLIDGKIPSIVSFLDSFEVTYINSNSKNNDKML
jgi:hypothetical protein